MPSGLRLLAPLAAACCWLAAAIQPAAAQAPMRHITVVLSPAEGDVALAELSFAHARGRTVGAASLRLRPPAYSADDLIALATPAHPRGSARVALMLVANRPTNLVEPPSLRVGALASPSLGVARVRLLEDPVKQRGGRPGWLCALAAHGHAPLLRSLGARGTPIAGLGAAGAVTQAFEIACGLRAGHQLEAALAFPQPVPAPEPAPAPEAPKCAPCNPKPGFACPLNAVAAYCIAPRAETAPHAAAGR